MPCCRRRNHSCLRRLVANQALQHLGAAPLRAALSATPNYRPTMFLARVEGSVVSTKKEASMNGRKLLLLRPQLVDEKDPTKFRPGVNTVIAVDTLGAGIGELVMFCQGSSARLAAGMKEAPIDAVIIGIVDSVDVLGKQIFNARQ